MKRRGSRSAGRWPQAAVVMAAVLALVACARDTGLGSTPPTPDQTTTTASPSSTDADAPTTTETPIDYETVECGELEGALVCETYELIARHYVDPVSDEALVEGAITALTTSEVPSGDGIDVCPLPSEAFTEVCDVVDSEALDAEAAEEAIVAGMTYLALDPNSGYFDAQMLELVEEEQSGQIEGIGALVATEEEGSDETNTCQIISPTCRLRIVSTIEGGPAQAADLQTGDEFLAVDGESIEGWTVDQVTGLVRGPAGTDVDLRFSRQGEEFTVTITRATVQVPVVESERVDDTAYVQLNVFTDNADEQLRHVLEELLADRPARLVLDLRNNPGGLLETAVAVTSEFLNEGLVVRTQSPQTETPYAVEPGGVATDPGLELFIAVNRGSASASEVVAGALSDAGRAVIVGENTFGKNTVQQRFPLSNGGALKLTIARWLTPAGHDFGGTGIEPDIMMELPPELTPAEVVEHVTAGAAGTAVSASTSSTQLRG